MVTIIKHAITNEHIFLPVIIIYLYPSSLKRYTAFIRIDILMIVRQGECIENVSTCILKPCFNHCSSQVYISLSTLCLKFWTSYPSHHKLRAIINGIFS